MKIAMTGIYVHNPIEAFKFYTEILGFKERMYVPQMYLAIVTAPDDPDGTGLLLEPNNNPVAKDYQEALYNAGLPVITFGSDNIQQEYEILKARGVVFRKPPTETDWGMEALFEDTFGNLIQLTAI